MSELVARAKMLIRCAAAEAFDAFIQPQRIISFWLKGTTGPLAPGAQVDWEFMVPGAIERVNVTAFDQPRHIAFTWSGGGLEVDIKFIEMQSDITVVSVEARGFNDDGGMEQAINATEGFTIVLCDLKVLLESGHSANLVKDKAELIHCARE
jgi:uncharacterized protein YndB with AHSA1/START domain